MSDAARSRVQKAARDASSGDDLVKDEYEVMWDENDMVVPIDEETLDERHSTQMGEQWESTRRDAN